MAAVLHDVLEDCGVSTIKLAEVFNKEVSKIVEELSSPKNIDSKEKDWKKKKIEYIELIKNASTETFLIIAVDKMFNMKAYFEHAVAGNIDLLNKLFGGNLEDYFWYYGEIYSVLDSKLNHQNVITDYKNVLQYYRSKLII